MKLLVLVMILASLRREYIFCANENTSKKLYYFRRHIPKEEFKSAKNDALDPEPYIDCEDCGRRLHQVCVLHMDKISRS